MQLARWGELGEEGLGERTKERSDSIWFKHSISLHYHHKNINTWKLPSYRTLSDRLDNYVSDRDVMHKKLWPCSSAMCTCWLGSPKWVQSHPPPSMGSPSARTQGTSGIRLLWSQWCFQVLPDLFTSSSAGKEEKQKDLQNSLAEGICSYEDAWASSYIKLPSQNQWCTCAFVANLPSIFLRNLAGI